MKSRFLCSSSLLLWAGCASMLFSSDALSAAEVRLSSGCGDNWGFFNGAEFPGAEGGISRDGAKGAWKLDYDFSKGGLYVATQFGGAIPCGETVQMLLEHEQLLSLNYRLIDKNGRTFQGVSKELAPGSRVESFALTGPWSSVWGGDKGDYGAPEFPIRNFILMVEKRDDVPAGSFYYSNLDVVSEAEIAQSYHADTETVSFGDWQVTLEPKAQFSGAMLGIRAENNGNGQPLNLTVTFPQNGRDAYAHYALTPEAETAEFSYKLPFLAENGNPKMIYTLTVSVENPATGATLNVPFQFRGAESRERMALIPSTQSENIFGSACHFNFGMDPNGPFGGWHNYAVLQEKLAAIGVNYIREELSAEKMPDGSYQIRPWDLNWAKNAKRLGIDLICIISMDANEPVEDYLKRIDATVQGTREFANIYELGNEPNNFGGWIGKFGGMWNGRNADNSTAAWVVEQVKMTNIGAERIKELYPEATVIGLGGTPPSNFRSISLGLSEALDGVVDHPYGYSLPPEQVPFGMTLLERDGVELGDAKNTFRGLVESYFEHCRKNGKERSLWLTEFGFTSYFQDGTNEGGLYIGYNETTQAAYLVRRMTEAAALGVSAAIQYDFLDDYGSVSTLNEANFGLIHGDYSPKPAYYAIGRMIALLNGFNRAWNVSIDVTHAPLHRGAAATLLAKWDGADIVADDGVRAYAFDSQSDPSNKLLAIWSALPYNGETNNRIIDFEIKGWESEGFQSATAYDPVKNSAIELAFEQKEDGTILVKQLSLENTPLFLEFQK